MYKELFNNSEYKLTQEAIANQMKDKKFTNALNNEINEIYTYLIGKPNLKPDNYRNDKPMDKHLSSLEELITNRFNIPYKIIGSDSFLYTIPFHNYVESDIIDGTTDTIKLISKLNRKHCKDGTCRILDKDTLRSEADLTNSAIASTLREHMSVVTEMLDNGDIIVNHKDAKIEGMRKILDKKGIFSLIACNFHKFINDAISPTELAGAIIHEVGHQFNMIASANKHVKRLHTISQSLTDDSESNESKVKLISPLKGDNNATIEDHVMALTKEVSQLQIDVANESSFYANEIYADQFATRFGYGADVVFSIKKYRRDERMEYPILTIMISSILIMVIATLVVIMPLIVILWPNLVVAFFTSVGSLLIPNIQDIGDVHEQSFARARRVKLDLIRQLRTSKKLHITEITEILDTILSIEPYISSLKVDKTAVQLFSTLLRGNSTRIGYHEVYQRLEQITENDIHIMSQKLKILGS